MGKENSPDPEGGVLYTQPGDNETMLGDGTDDGNHEKHTETLAEVVAEEDDDIGKWKLTHREKHAQSALSKLADAEMPDRYKLPLVELAESIKLGSEKRSRSIVQILMDVLTITRNDLAKIKSDHTARLEMDYDTSWNLKDTHNAQRLAQDDQRATMENN